MNDIRIAGAPSSFNMAGIVVAGLIGQAFFSAVPTGAVGSAGVPRLEYSSASGSYGEQIFRWGREVSQTDFVRELQGIYSDLLARQELLDPEFKRVLYDNLNALYLR